MKIVLQYRASPGFRRNLAEAFDGWSELSVVDETDEATFTTLMAEAEVLLHVLKPVTAQVIAGAPKLRLVHKLGVGVNTIDLEAARARGIQVANMPGSNSQAVAEMTLMLMLATLRRAAYFDRITRAGEGWRPDLDLLDSSGEICGRTVGFFGFGSVPSRLAPALTALGAEVIYTARSPKPEAPYAFVGLDELLARADILSLNAPATPETRGLIGAAALARMKPGAMIVNTARGELIDETALAAAIRSGHIAGAGLDVFAAEPAGADNPLFALPQVVVAPHIAWLTPETLKRSIAIARENCRRLAAGEALVNRVV
ncbi:2-hydroxyacid dehydrogenase [Phenylobacterium montanum]|uniref:2-hydroxyacid dehydrogenase n=1 Tax=Phenylobacterium montanum TaxID=2823693 RepID=A0A975FYR8_9CAUL|nr:2-hydroxyacid dehydrogenase [Caulobacter sp. S6]QUD87651.1 2-hydroxyacid dehydrogenase [Caulobacter sp. S6]